ncbi:hypothetical protein [Halomicrococcus gelatinilyticus]|uniref:hypothetical protein n=1 Tax=Halomicrococcus gelatinilyticus TaxID=1702103 RepID=UPI002E13CCDE
MDVRTLLAGVLGVALGLALVAFPDAVIRVQTAGRLPDDRGGEYGTGAATPERWRRLVQVLGVVFLAGGLYFAATVLG